MRNKKQYSIDKQNNIFSFLTIEEDTMGKFAVILLIAFGLDANARGYLMTGVGFTAPEILGSGNVPNPSAGDIILDAGATPAAFKGYNGSGWIELGGSAPDTVAARYTTVAGQSIPSGTGAIVDFGTSDYDTHSGVTTGSSWKFTAPVSGKYAVKGFVTFATDSFTASYVFSLDLYKNGNFYQRVGFARAVASSVATYVVQGSADIALSAGDYIDLRVSHTESTSRSLASGVGFNTISVFKFGE